MGWTLDKKTGVWKCTEYSDLQYAEITNLAEYGEPMSPYEPGFDPNFVPDFSNVIVEMPQSEVMTKGYGAHIHADSFPIVNRFLREKLAIPVGTYSFPDLVKLKFAQKKDRFLQGSLYGGGLIGLSPGTISAADAAYIHGTVSFGLKDGTSFSYSTRLRKVDAEIGAMDDNWDFESSAVPPFIEVMVGTFFGPDHYNLEKPIQINFRGPGKRSVAMRAT